MTKLFVVDFPKEVDELQLAQLFGSYGDIDLLTIVRDKFSKVSKGYGFVQMRTAAGAANAAAALGGYTFGDRTLEVRLAEEKPAAGSPSRSVAVSEQGDAPVRKKRPRLSR